jgi:hypothetical protein
VATGAYLNPGDSAPRSVLALRISLVDASIADFGSFRTTWRPHARLASVHGDLRPSDAHPRGERLGISGRMGVYSHGEFKATYASGELGSSIVGGTIVSALGQDGLGEPRVRIKADLRSLLLSLAVLGVGAFIARRLVLHLEGNTLRRLATAIAASAVGVAGLTQSVGRSCSGCGGWIRQLSIRGSEEALAELAQALRSTNPRAAEQTLRRIGDGESSGPSASLETRYCEGCGCLISWHLRAASSANSTASETLTGSAASALSSLLSAFRSRRGHDG